MLGLSFEKLILIVLVAGLIVGPQRLPLYAEKLAHLSRALRHVLDTTKERMTAELGPEFDPAELRKLDPRHYDPRRIVREALTDSDPANHIQEDQGNTPPDNAQTHTAAEAAPAPPKPTPPVAEGGWQHALLTRLATPHHATPPAPASLSPADTAHDTSTTPTLEMQKSPPPTA